MFLQKKPKYRTFWEILLIQLQSASNWLPLAVFKKTQDFFWKTIFLQDETIFQRFEKSYYFNCILQQIFKFGDFYKINFFFQKTHIFYLLKPNFEGLEKSYFFSRILPQVCYIQQFFWKKTNFFEKPTIFFHQKT